MTNSAMYIFFIKDTGIGIDKKDQKKIFQVFQQIDNNQHLIQHESSKQGTGLGLAICKELLNMMDSDLKVKSNGIGTGSEFTFMIPFQTEFDLRQIQGNHIVDVSRWKIIAVDDNLNNRLVMSATFHEWNIRYTMCASADEVLHYLRMDLTYNLAIIDICMPHISGIELAQKIRKEYPDLPLLALSSKEVESNGRVWFDDFYHQTV